MAAPSPGWQPVSWDDHRLSLTGQALIRFLRAAGMPAAASGIRREHLETFTEAQLARFRPSTAATRYRDLK